MTQADLAATSTTGPAALPPARPGRDVLRAVAANRLALGALVFTFVLVVLAFVGPLVLPTSPYRTDLSNLDSAPSWSHLFGTDRSGRDVFTRVVYATRTSMVVGFASVAIYIAIGTVLGTIAGFFGGIVDAVVSRTVDALLSIPLLLLATVFVAFLRPGILTVILVIGLLGWPATTRLARAETLSLRESDFIVAARVTGLPPTRIMRTHVLPNLTATLIVVASLGVGTAMLLEAALGFLGLGIKPPTPSLGVMITEAKNSLVLRNSPWIWMPPAAVLALLVMSINIVGDALRDALAPGSDGGAP